MYILFKYRNYVCQSHVILYVSLWVFPKKKMCNCNNVLFWWFFERCDDGVGKGVNFNNLYTTSVSVNKSYTFWGGFYAPPTVLHREEKEVYFVTCIQQQPLIILIIITVMMVVMNMNVFLL